jgi:hypothetical protein
VLRRSNEPLGAIWVEMTEILVRPGGDLFAEAEVLLDGGDADFKLEAFVDLGLLELGQLGIDSIELPVEDLDAAVKPRFDCGEIVFGCHFFAKIRDIVLGGHALDHETEHFAEFFERGFLRHVLDGMSL